MFVTCFISWSQPPGQAYTRFGSCTSGGNFSHTSDMKELQLCCRHSWCNSVHKQTYTECTLLSYLSPIFWIHLWIHFYFFLLFWQYPEFFNTTFCSGYCCYNCSVSAATQWIHQYMCYWFFPWTKETEFLKCNIVVSRGSWGWISSWTERMSCRWIR